MRRLLAMAIVLCVAPAALGEIPPPQSRAHPAVVRIIAPEHDGTSYGSGALVGVNRTYGLVVTNWHVVGDANGPITVVFPDGFSSSARVLKTDRDWDLAALSIWRPRAEPISLAEEAPRPGEVLTIAGYGPGWFRTAAGQCTQYVSPGGNHPFEMVELAAPARNGDSGGPILNRRGELAGVLFGTASGRTTGSYCGRVRWFLGPVLDDFQGSAETSTMIARQPPREPSPPAAGNAQPRTVAVNDVRQGPSSQCELAELPSLEPAAAPAAEVAVAVPSPGPAEGAGSTRAEQIKTILAAIGVLALLFHGLRLLSIAQDA